MATKARRAGSLATIISANTSAASNTVVIDSGGDISLTGSLTVSGDITDYATNAHVQAVFAQNSYVQTLASDYLQVSNADVKFVTKSTALTSNNALINLINDRYQVANADVKFVTKSVQLTSNNSLVNLINDRIQVANVDTTIATYWPSANVIAYTAVAISNASQFVNTSIFIASGGENRVAIPYTNTNFMLVYLNGVLLTEDTDYVAANNAHIGDIDPPLVQGDVLLVEEFKNHNANTTNRTPVPPVHVFGGTTSGYASGGTPFTTSSNVIDKFPFASDGNASDVGDLTVGRRQVSGQSGSTSGYTSGGYGTTPPFATKSNVIDKFPFASNGNATDVGDMTVGRINIAGQSSADNGYITGGDGSPYSSDIIEKFPFASDGNATDVGDLATESNGGTGTSSSSDGYHTGGNGSGAPVMLNCIQKFSFSSDGNATDHADLVYNNKYAAGQASTTHGYIAGGPTGNPAPTCNPAGNLNQLRMIQKFPFSSGTQATDIGDLTANRCASAGQSSTANGYTSGGQPLSNIIDKFSFSSDGNATDVGDLTAGRGRLAGQQV